MRLIHYGDTQFREELFTEIKNDEYSNKPIGGLWCCNEETDDWRRFCEQENLCLDKLEKSFTVSIKPRVKILMLDHPSQLKYLPHVDKEVLGYRPLDFELLAREYDIICYKHSYLFSHILYGWDLDSYLILNKEAIEWKIN